MSKILRFLKLVFIMVPILIVDYFLRILPYSLHIDKVPLKKRFFKVQKLCRRCMKAFGVISFTHDVEEFYAKRSDDNYLIVCNHLSLLDPLFMVSIAQRPVSFVAKKELRHVPFVARIIKIIDGEFLDRSDLKQELKVFSRVQKRLAGREKIDTLIFPEGTRNKDHDKEIDFYHHGTFRPAYKEKLPIAVFVLSGTWRMFSVEQRGLLSPVDVAYVGTLNKDDYASKTTSDIAEVVHTRSNEVYDTLKKDNDRHALQILH